MQKKITPFLWFNNNAEEAITFYTSLFKNSSIKNIARYGDEVPGMKGKVLTAIFELDGVEFMALDGGPMYQFTEAISMYVDCENQEEVDTLWNALLADGGQESRCGWLKDRFGMSWQIIPKALGEMMTDKDPKKAHNVMMAMMKMKKIIVSDLEKARDSA